MSSIRNVATAVAVVVLGLLGCQRANQTQVAVLNPTPIVEDEAMKLRQWSPSSARYPNGQTVAGPTLFALEPRRGMPEYRYLYTDAGVYLGNVFMLPYRFYQIPPWREVIYPGEVIGPSFTAMPPLPPEIDPEPLPEPAYIAPPTTQP